MTRGRLAHLKTIRVWVSLSFFLATTFVFVDPAHVLPSAAVQWIVSMQFIPAIIKTLMYGGLLSFCSITAVLLLTLLFGRIYCSSICPLGTLQDLFVRIRLTINRRRRFSFQATSVIVHLSVGVLSLVLVAYGSTLVMALLEPLSNFGRITAGVVQPVITVSNNGLAYAVEWLEVYGLYRIPLRDPALPALIWGLAFLAFLCYVTFRNGRWFCNVLCPAGAVLRAVSAASVFRIGIDLDACSECGACEKICKAQCIDSHKKVVDHHSCVACFNCLTVCPTEGVRFSPSGWKRQYRMAVAPDVTRRRVLANIVMPGFLLPLTQVIDTLRSKAGEVGYEENRPQPISPPGSLTISRYSRLCTACHLCVNACPAQVLAPSFLEYGVTGIFQPRMDYSASYCTYDCTICGQVCPTGAILPLDISTKKEVQIGKTTFVKEDCVVVAKKKDCGACAEHCPTKAVKMVPHEGRLTIPDLDNELCVGCGACEHACPTVPRKAIFVRGNTIHQKARKPKVEKPLPGFTPSEEFPF